MIREREADMATMNRFDNLNSELFPAATFYIKKERGLGFMCSSEERQIRGNCVMAYGCSQTAA